MKTCTSCNIQKPVSEFYKRVASPDGLNARCKACKKQADKTYRAVNKEKKRAADKAYRSANENEIKAKKAEYYQENKSRILKKAKRYYKENSDKIKNRSKKYRKNNKKKVNAYFRKYNAKQREDGNIQYILSKSLRSRINKVVKGEIKSGSALRDLGCSMSELIIHLESQFSEGMSWDNYGEWHIDHVIPLVNFNLSIRGEFLKACHYTNLQPLWAKDNISKGARLL